MTSIYLDSCIIIGLIERGTFQRSLLQKVLPITEESGRDL